MMSLDNPFHHQHHPHRESSRKFVHIVIQVDRTRQSTRLLLLRCVDSNVNKRLLQVFLHQDDDDDDEITPLLPQSLFLSHSPSLSSIDDRLCLPTCFCFCFFFLLLLLPVQNNFKSSSDFVLWLCCCCCCCRFSSHGSYSRGSSRSSRRRSGGR